MYQSVEYLFGAVPFVPHGNFLLWRADLVAMNAVADAVIAASYFSMPAALGIFIRRRKDLVYRWALWLFLVFLLACGFTHLVAVLSLWLPIDGAEAILKVATAGAALVMAIVLWPLVPKLFDLPSPSALAEANAKLQRTIEARDHALGQLQHLFDWAPDPMVIVNRRGEILRGNRQMEKLFGYPSEALAGRPVETLMPQRYREQHARLREDFFKAPATGPMATGQELFVCSNQGREVQVEISLSALEMDGQTVVCAALRDISERGEAERHRQAAARNEMLIREIHHRIKNNLQVVSSLLNVRIGSVSDPAALDIISESQRRIQSISLIHQKFYGTPELGVIDFGEYVRDLCSDLSDTFGTLMSGVCLHLDTQYTRVSLHTAIPCGLIINELVTNALKHAFPAGRAGSVTIKLHSLEDQFELEVHDDGIGLAANCNGHDRETRGLQLVSLLTKQLRGTLTRIEGGRGTAFRISFADVHYRAHGRPATPHTDRIPILGTKRLSRSTQTCVDTPEPSRSDSMARDSR